jgi:ribosomal protein S18 acetylase RimI-like enzyme
MIPSLSRSSAGISAAESVTIFMNCLSFGFLGMKIILADWRSDLSDPLIRPYKSDDFEALTSLWRRAREQAFPEFQRAKGHTFEEDQAYFRDVILVNNDVWVAEVDGEPVAFMAIAGDFIDQLYVSPEHQRQGLGKALLKRARELSPEHLWLYTLQVNTRGRAFYEGNGFRAVKLGISPPPESEPDVEYHWGETK